VTSYSVSYEEKRYFPGFLQNHAVKIIIRMFFLEITHWKLTNRIVRFEEMKNLSAFIFLNLYRLAYLKTANLAQTKEKTKTTHASYLVRKNYGFCSMRQLEVSPPALPPSCIGCWSITGVTPAIFFGVEPQLTA